MKKITFFFILFILSTFVMAQTKKVAVYVKGQDSGINKVLGDRLVSAFKQTGEYIAIERTDSFLAGISKEQEYQRNGTVDDKEISNLGKQFGAQLVCVVIISPIFNENYVSARLIDVETAEVVSIANETSTLDSMEELFRVSNALKEELLNNKSAYDKEKEEQKAAIIKAKKEKLENDPFIQKGFNQYVSFALGNGISYGGGNIIGLAFSGRFGNRFGIEPHISIGAIYQNYSYYDAHKYHYYNYGYYEDNYTFSLNRSKIGKTMVSYNVGVNAYVFKGFYLGINYGVQKLDIIDHYFDDYDKRYNEYINTPHYYYHETVTHYNYYEGYVSDVYYKGREEERFTYSLHKGMSFLAGYKCYIGDKSRNGVCVYFDFGAGVKCYSETNLDFGFEKFDFAWNFGFGIAF